MRHAGLLRVNVTLSCFYVFVVFGLAFLAVFAAAALVRLQGSFGLLGFWHASCAIVDGDGSFSWWRVSRSILVFREERWGALLLQSGSRLGPIIIVISIDNVNHM